MNRTKNRHKHKHKQDTTNTLIKMNISSWRLVRYSILAKQLIPNHNVKTCEDIFYDN